MRDVSARWNRSRRRELVVGIPGPSSVTDDHRIVAVDPDHDDAPGSGRRVRADVGEQVVEHLPQPARVAVDRDHVVDPQCHLRSGSTACAGVDRRHRDLAQVDAVDVERTALVELGEQQQILDELGHAGRLGADPGHGSLEVVGTIARPRSNSSA